MSNKNGNTLQTVNKGMDWDSLDAILTIPEAARFCKVGYRRMLEICHTKGGPALRVGRGWRINRDALRAWFERQTA